MLSIYETITVAGVGLTALAAFACAPFLTDAIAMTYERFFGPIHDDHDDDLHA